MHTYMSVKEMVKCRRCVHTFETKAHYTPGMGCPGCPGCAETKPSEYCDECQKLMLRQLRSQISYVEGFLIVIFVFLLFALTYPSGWVYTKIGLGPTIAGFVLACLLFLDTIQRELPSVPLEPAGVVDDDPYAIQ